MLTIHRYYNRPPQTPIVFDEPTLTQQHFKDDCDINNIVRRFIDTGSWSDELATRRPMFGDFTQSHDYYEAQNIIAESKTLFEELPSALRKRFNNEPAEMLAFLENENNRQEAVALGLVNPDPVPAPDLETAGT